MPFIRYNRDRRGYESTLVMHAYRSPQGAQQHRVLYLFRSPSNLQVGRRPLDEEVMEALAHTHPDLAFDWPVLLRGQIEARSDARPKSRRPAGRPVSGAGAGPARRAPVAEPPPPEAVIDDQSLLGRVLGAAEAARIRLRYGDLLQRIARRARTPEDRDRLSERAQRLNPDEWIDEAAVRAAAGSVETEMSAIAAELPQRRRGRRGGRRRGPEGQAPTGPSDIMEASGETHAVENQHPVGTDWASDTAGDSRGVGPEPDDQGSEADDLSGEG